MQSSLRYNITIVIIVLYASQLNFVFTIKEVYAMIIIINIDGTEETEQDHVEEKPEVKEVDLYELHRMPQLQLVDITSTNL
jgi:energy-converting hydrogenase Eha subunit H